MSADPVPLLAFGPGGRLPGIGELFFTHPPEVAEELLAEWNEHNQRAAGEPFRAVYTHRASTNGHPRHQSDAWPPLDHTYTTDLERAAAAPTLDRE